MVYKYKLNNIIFKCKYFIQKMQHKLYIIVHFKLNSFEKNLFLYFSNLFFLAFL